MKQLILLAVFSLSIFSCSLFSSKDSDNKMKEDIEKMKENMKQEIEKKADEMSGIDNEKRERLLKQGKQAPATIEKVEDTRVTVNKNPKVRLFIKVKPEKEESFDAVVEMVVSRVDIPRRGDNVTVFYNPEDKKKIIVK